MYFTRPSLAQYTPQGAELGIHLLPNNNTWPLLIKGAGQISLLNNSGLTLEQLAPSVHGPISYYHLSAGPVLVFRGEMSDELERSLIAQKIIIQKPDKHIYVLSDQPVQLVQTRFKQSWTHRLDPRYFGSIIEYDTEKLVSKPIKVTRNSITIELGEFQGPALSESLPNSTFAALKLGPNSDQHELFSSLLELVPELTLNLYNDLNQHGGQIMFGYDANSQQTQFKLEINRAYSETELKQIHLGLAGSQTPEVKAKKLPDGSSISEMVMDIEDIKVENITIGGRTAIQSKNLITVSSETKTEFANTADLINIQQTAKETFICANDPIGVFYPQKIPASLISENIHSNRLFNILSAFVEISLDKKDSTVLIKACLP
ncbi:MAG: hypothetical protein ABIG32_00490 [Candidatus Uhrbacteria bacterium]